MALWVRRNADWNKGRRNIKHDRDLEYLIIRLFKALNGRGHKWVPSLPVVLIFLRLYFHIFNPLHDIWKGCNFRDKPWFLKFSKFYAFYIYFFFIFTVIFHPKKSQILYSIIFLKKVESFSCIVLCKLLSYDRYSVIFCFKKIVFHFIL